jgi:hypothetical protein
MLWIPSLGVLRGLTNSILPAVPRFDIVDLYRNIYISLSNRTNIPEKITAGKFVVNYDRLSEFAYGNMINVICKNNEINVDNKQLHNKSLSVRGCTFDVGTNNFIGLQIKEPIFYTIQDLVFTGDTTDINYIQPYLNVSNVITFTEKIELAKGIEFDNTNTTIEFDNVPDMGLVKSRKNRASFFVNKIEKFGVNQLGLVVGDLPLLTWSTNWLQSGTTTINMCLGNFEGTLRYRCPMNIRIKVIVVSVDGDATWTTTAPLYQPTIFFPVLDGNTETQLYPTSNSITFAVLFTTSILATARTSTYFICDDIIPELTRLRGDGISIRLPQIGGREAHIQLLGYQIPGDDVHSTFL